MKAEKLQEMVDDRYYILVESEEFKKFGDHAWPSYCREHGIKFSDELKNRWVCVDNPEYHDRFEQGLDESSSHPFLLIPKEFAEKCLVLGGLP